MSATRPSAEMRRDLVGIVRVLRVHVQHGEARRLQEARETREMEQVDVAGRVGAAVDVAAVSAEYAHDWRVEVRRRDDEETLVVQELVRLLEDRSRLSKMLQRLPQRDHRETPFRERLDAGTDIEPARPRQLDARRIDFEPNGNQSALGRQLQRVADPAPHVEITGDGASGRTQQRQRLVQLWTDTLHVALVPKCVSAVVRHRLGERLGLATLAEKTLEQALVDVLRDEPGATSSALVKRIAIVAVEQKTTLGGPARGTRAGGQRLEQREAVGEPEFQSPQPVLTRHARERRLERYGRPGERRGLLEKPCCQHTQPARQDRQRARGGDALENAFGELLRGSLSDPRQRCFHARSVPPFSPFGSLCRGLRRRQNGPSGARHRLAEPHRSVPRCRGRSGLESRASALCRRW